MKKKITDSIVLFGLLSLLSGCAGMTKHRDESSMKDVKKVAVIGFQATMPSSSLGGLNSKSPETDQMFSEFPKALVKAQSWNVMDVQQMKTHPSYTSAYHQTMDGWQNKITPAPGKLQYLVDGIMDANATRLLKLEGRDQLMTSLGVDALAIVSVYVDMKGFSVMGIGGGRPQSHAHVEVFKKGVEKPIWFDTFIGEESKESAVKVGFVDEKKLGQLALSSTRSAYSKMGSQIQ